jgi:hypothetical protein
MFLPNAALPIHRTTQNTWCHNSQGYYMYLFAYFNALTNCHITVTRHKVQIMFLSSEGVLLGQVINC